MSFPRIGSKLVIATHNSGKLEEIGRLLEGYAVDVVSAGALGLPEPEETEDSFVGNARLKAHAAAVGSGFPALADDSGICVDVLDGAPGVYTADWASTPTGRDFGLAMEKTYAACLLTERPPPWTARFHCTLVLAWPTGEDAVFEGTVEGVLQWPPRGGNGHGYDPMFVPLGSSVTFGEMDRWEKNLISHRADAFRKFVAHCFT